MQVLDFNDADVTAIRDASWSGRTLNALRDSRPETEVTIVDATLLSVLGKLAIKAALDVFNDERADMQMISEYWRAPTAVDAMQQEQWDIAEAAYALPTLTLPDL